MEARIKPKLLYPKKPSRGPQCHYIFLNAECSTTTSKIITKKKRRKEGEEERMEEGKILLLGIRGLKMKKTNMLSPSSKDHRKATANSHVMKFRTHKC